MIDEHGKRAVEWLTDLREGHTLNEFGRELERVVEGVHTTIGPGTLTLTLKLAMQKDSDDTLLTVDIVTAKIPEHRIDKWYIGADGQLTRYRPRNRDQAALPFDDEDPDRYTDGENERDEVPLPYRDDD
jgi:hypothetical protein